MQKNFFKKGWQSTSLICFIWFIFLGSNSVQAVQISNIYEEEIEVEDQTQSQRTFALKRAFKNVLIRLNGSKKVLYEPSLASALENPKRYLLSFNYKENSVDHPSTISENKAIDTTTQTDNKPRQLISFKFDTSQIESLFFQNNIALWPNERPEILVWWGIDSLAEPRRIYTSKSKESSLLEQKAIHRGLPVRLPLMDTRDKDLLTISDIWALDLKQVEIASKRYRGQVILLAKSTENASGEWFTQWGLEVEGKVSWFETVQSSKEASFTQVFHETAELLSKEYSVVMNGQVSEDLSMIVDKIHSIKQYAQLIDILDQMQVITSFKLIEVQDRRLKFNLRTNTSIDQLKYIFRLKRRFRLLEHEQVSQLPQQSIEVESSSSNTIIDASKFSAELNSRIESDSTNASTPVLQYEWIHAYEQ